MCCACMLVYVCVVVCVCQSLLSSLAVHYNDRVDCSHCVLVPALCIFRSEKLWGGARGTQGAFAGRVYYEVRQEASTQDI